MRIRVTNNEVARLWACQSQPEARSDSMFFEGPIIYSYGRHFPIAMHTEFKGKPCALKTTRDHSNTTAKHKSLVSAWLYSRRIVTIHVSDPTVYKIDPEAIRLDFARQVEDQIAGALRATTCCTWKMDWAKKMIDQFNFQLVFLDQPLLALPDEWDAYVNRAIQRQDECEQRRIARYAAKKLHESNEPVTN